MLLRDGRLLVLVGEPVNGEIPVFAVGSIIDLLHSDKNPTGNPLQDLTNGYDIGLLPCSEKEWRKIQRWIASDMYITVEYTNSGKYRFGRVPMKYLKQNGYLTESDIFWVNAWADSVREYSERQQVKQKPEPKKKKLKRKERRKLERKIGFDTHDFM